MLSFPTCKCSWDAHEGTLKFWRSLVAVAAHGGPLEPLPQYPYRPSEKLLPTADTPLLPPASFRRRHVWGGGLLLSCLLIIAIPLPFILIRYGERIRASSPYAASQTGLAQQAAAANGQVVTGENSDIKKASSDVESQRGLDASGPQTRVATPEPAVGAKEDEVKEGQAEVKTE